MCACRQPPPGLRFRPKAGESELKALMQLGVQHVLVTRLQHQVRQPPIMGALLLPSCPLPEFSI